MRDQDIRNVIWERLEAEHASDPDTLMLDELSLAHGSTRVDVAVINGELQGYELKSAKDTLERLPTQVSIYSTILDRATLVVSECHLEKALPALPEWWGVWIATRKSGHIALLEDRPPQLNPNPNPVAVASLLWRQEALQKLVDLGADRGVRGKPREQVYDRLALSMDLPSLQKFVRRTLKDRCNWRSDRRQIRCDD